MQFIQVGQYIFNIKAIAYVEWQVVQNRPHEVYAVIHTFAHVTPSSMTGMSGQKEPLFGRLATQRVFISAAEDVKGLWRYFQKSTPKIINVREVS